VHVCSEANQGHSRACRGQTRPRANYPPGALLRVPGKRSRLRHCSGSGDRVSKGQRLSGMAAETPCAASDPASRERRGCPTSQERNMNRVTDSRIYWSILLSIPVGVAGMLRWPFPEENALLQLVLLERPVLFFALKYTYLAMLFST